MGANPVLDVTLADDSTSSSSSERETRGGPLMRRTQQFAKAGVGLIVTWTSLVLVEFALMLVSTSGLAFGHVHVPSIIGTVHLLVEVSTRSIL